MDYGLMTHRSSQADFVSFLLLSGSLLLPRDLLPFLRLALHLFCNCILQLSFEQVEFLEQIAYSLGAQSYESFLFLLLQKAKAAKKTYKFRPF